MKKAFFCFLAALGLFFLSACGGKIPEPEPTPTPTPTPKPDVTLTLGETAKFTAASLLGDALTAKLVRGEGDMYSLDFSGDGIELIADPLAGYDGSKMFSKFLNTPLTTSFTLAKKPTAPGDDKDIDLSALLPDKLNGGSVSMSYSFGFSGFPASLTELQGVNLTDDSSFEVAVSLANPCFTAGTLTPTFTVDLSSLFGISGAENGVLTFDMELTPENGYSMVKNFHPESFTVKSENYNPSTMSVRADLSASAMVTAVHSGLKTTRSRLEAALSPFKLNVRLVLKKVTIDSFTGKFKYSMKDGASSVNLALLGTRIGGTENTLESLGLDPSAGKLSMDVESLFPVEADAKIGVTAKKSRTSVGSVSDIPLVIPARDETGPAKVQYDLSKFGDVSPLLKKVATEMAFTAGAKGKDAVGTFRIGEPAKVTLVPSVNIPMCFGAALSYTTEERLDLPQNAAAALKDGALTVLGTLTNTFPVSLSAFFVLVDAAGVAVSDEASLSVAAESTSNVQLPFKAKSGSSLENAKTAVLKYTIKGIDGSRPIKATDYIQANLNAKVSYQ
ncbi:MAG: hypothetical protein IKX53_09375 [Bacteroidales bacterium]|nr:hypothetical protein [Bacteroidales bacterium]